MRCSGDSICNCNTKPLPRTKQQSKLNKAIDPEKSLKIHTQLFEFCYLCFSVSLFLLARRFAIVACLAVWLFVCLSHAHIVSKRLNLS